MKKKSCHNHDARTILLSGTAPTRTLVGGQVDFLGHPVTPKRSVVMKNNTCHKGSPSTRSEGMNRITRKNLEKAIRQQPKLLGRTLGKCWIDHVFSLGCPLDKDLIPLESGTFWRMVSDRLINPEEVRPLLRELSGYMGDECYHPKGLHFIREDNGWGVYREA